MAEQEVKQRYNKLLQKLWGKKFTLNRLLGRGGQSFVFSLAGSRTPAQVVKIIPIKEVLQAQFPRPASPEQFAAAVRRLDDYARQEVKAMQDLADCANTVQLMEARRYQDPLDAQNIVWFLRMIRLIPFISASNSLNVQLHGISNDRFAGFVGASISNAIVYMKKKNLLHRDIKLDNIVLDWSSREVFESYKSTGKLQVYDLAGITVRLNDFGIGKKLRDEPQTVTGIGTRGKIAPELLSHRKIIGSQSDIYSLGVTLQELYRDYLHTVPCAEMQTLLARMTADSPLDRPTPEKALEALQSLAGIISPQKGKPARKSAPGPIRSMVNLYKSSEELRSSSQLVDCVQMARNLRCTAAYLILANESDNAQETEKYLRLAAQSGSLWAAWRLAVKKLQSQPETAVDILQRAAAAGCTPASQTLQFLLHEEPIPKNAFQDAFAEELEKFA